MAPMTAPELIERSDHWVLPLESKTVTQCRVDYAFTVVLGDTNASFEIRIEQPLAFKPASGEELTIDPENEPTAIGPALAILHERVSRAVAHKDGRLELEFQDGAAIRVAASGKFEAWNLVGPEGLRLVSLPDGGLTIWSGNESEGEQPGA